jgi:hypothetical protein
MLLPTLQPVLFLSLMIIVKAAQIRISGSISNDTQFYSNSTYLIENDLVVEFDATLTIMPNVTIEIKENSSIMVMGKLDFLGTQSQPISLRYIRNGAISDYYFEINIIFYSYFAKSSTILNLNIFANISVNCVHCRLFRVETSYSHRFENITVINQGQYTWGVEFNNLNNPLKKAKVIGLNLKNTNFYANSVYNFELLNSDFIESPSSYRNYESSPPDYSFQYISNRLPSQNFSKIVIVSNKYLPLLYGLPSFYYSQYYFNYNYTNQINLNESDAIYSITPDYQYQLYASEIAFLFQIVMPANSSQLLLAITSSYLNNYPRIIRIYYWDSLILTDKIGHSAFYYFNFLPANSSYTLFFAIVLPSGRSSYMLSEKLFFKFSSNEAPVTSSSGLLIKDSYFHKSSLIISTNAKTRIDSIVFNNSDTFTYWYGEIEIVNSQVTNCQNLDFEVRYRKSFEMNNNRFSNNVMSLNPISDNSNYVQSFEMSNNLFSNNVMGVTVNLYSSNYVQSFEMSNNLFSNNVMSVRATSYYSISARTSIVIKSNMFLRNSVSSDFLIQILATSNVSISNNTFNNNATASNIENREFILQIQDETQNETTYDLSMNKWLTLNSTILVHSYYYYRFLTVKLNETTYTQNTQVDSLGSLFLNESQTTIVLKKTSSPYYLRSRLTIGIHQTLIVEPGVEIRAMIDGVIVVYGSLILNGTSSSPIVIDGSRTNDYLIVSRRYTEKQHMIYFFMKTNQTSSLINHVNFRNFQTYQNTEKIMVIDGYMPKFSNLNFDYRQSEICVIQAFDEKISFENINTGENGFISISSDTNANIEISNVNINTVRILPPWSILDYYYTNNLDIFCNLGNSNSYYVSSLDSRASTVILKGIYKLPCQICFTTDLGSHFSILTRGNVPVDITDLNNQSKIVNSVLTGNLINSFALSNKICITFKNQYSVIIRAFRQDPIFALNDFASANSTYLFSNLFKANFSYLKIENMSLNFYTVSNSSSVMSFESNQIENKNDSLKKIVGILFYINTPIPLELLVNIRCLNKTYGINTKLTSALKGKVQIYFKSDIIKTINTNQFSLGFDLSYQSLNRSVTIQLNNFTLLSIFEYNNLYETSVNYRIVDSTLGNFQIYQHEFDSYKMTNIEISNVVFDNSKNYDYSNAISISMVSLNSLNIKDCIFQGNDYNSRNLIEVNTFVPDGPSNTLFYRDSNQKFPTYYYGYTSPTLNLNGDAFLRKYYNSTSQIQIVNNIFQNNLNLGIITIYEQCSSMDYYQQVKILNNSFINNKVTEHLIGYINEMKVKHVQIEGNLFFSNYLYTPTDYSVVWQLRYYPYLSNRTEYCSNGTLVQTRASCLISLFMTNENEIPNNLVNITRNLFHRNRIEVTSDLCFFSTFKRCSNATTVIKQPILISYNAFMNNILNNSNSFDDSSYSYYSYPYVKKVAEVFGLDDYLDLSLNWWNTKSAQDVSAKVISSALISNNSYLYKSEQRLLTSLPDLFGLRSTLCGNIWYEHENKCYFTISSSLTYEMAVQTCSSLYGSIASYSNELIGFVKSTSSLRNTSSLWLRNNSCIVLMNESLILNKTKCREKNNFVCEQDAVYVPPTCSDGVSQPFGNNSFCSGQNLICARGYTGPDCSQFKCPFNCSKHGKCVAPDECECNNNWKGSYCSVNFFIIQKRVVTNIENKIPHNLFDINSFLFDISYFQF